MAVLSGCAAHRGSAAGATDPMAVRVGLASYYGRSFQGRVTASGEKYDADKLTAAHRTLPFGTKVRVTNLANGRDVVVKINDRGPYKAERIIDLSLQAARKLQFGHQGITRVRIEVQ
jgi:rare lipoprotein A